MALNLDATTRGTFAEIGAGQEVVRWFFSVGNAAGTVAKSTSAYDKEVSDKLYGDTKQYVSRERLIAMLDQEYAELREELGPEREDKRRLFAFADTVATSSQPQHGIGRAWLGIRFQALPDEEPSEIILHAHLRDFSAARQREVLGVLGVNLIHGAYFRRDNVNDLIAALMDELSRNEIDLDVIKFAGPAFPDVDHRLLSLQLVKLGYTDAVIFTAKGDVVQPSEMLYKKPILVERGSFRPATNLTLDLLNNAYTQFLEDPAVEGHDAVVLAEMTLRSLMPGADPSHADFLARTDILAALGFDVLISRFEGYYQLAEYLAAYTDKPIGIAIGLPMVRRVVDEKYYKNLAGGVIESIGRLFTRNVKMYVYPTRDPVTGVIETVHNAVVQPPWQHMLALLLEIGALQAIRTFNESYLSIQTPDVLARIERGDPTWQTMVPPAVAEIITAKQLFHNEPVLAGS